MIEAMACGTPVIARPCGSVPEVMRPGRTGFVEDTVDDMVEAVKRVDSIDRAECRRSVEQRFSVERMVDDYEAIFRRRASSAAMQHQGKRAARRRHATANTIRRPLASKESERKRAS